MLDQVSSSLEPWHRPPTLRTNRRSYLQCPFSAIAWLASEDMAGMKASRTKAQAGPWSVLLWEGTREPSIDQHLHKRVLGESLTPLASSPSLDQYTCSIRLYRIRPIQMKARPHLG